MSPHWVGQVIDQLKKVNTDHELQRIRLSASFAFTIVRYDQRFQILSRNDSLQSLKELRSSGTPQLR